jgi:hypothetical protein
MDEVDHAELMVGVGALDLGEAVLEACVPVPHRQRSSRRMQELRGAARPPHNCWRWWAGYGIGTRGANASFRASAIFSIATSS